VKKDEPQMINEKLVQEIKTIYDPNFATTGSLESDIEAYNIDLIQCLATLAAVNLGYTLKGGAPELEVYFKDGNYFAIIDYEITDVPIPLLEIISLIITFASENGNPLKYLKDKDDARST